MTDIVKCLEEFLPIEAPFQIDRVEKNDATQTAHLYISVSKSYRPFEDYPNIGSYYERTVEHVRLFEYRCFLHCRLPIYRNRTKTASKALEVPFSRPFGRFTLSYERQVMDLLRLHHCFTSVATQLKINVQRVESIYHYCTQAAFEAHEKAGLVAVKKVGIDETSTKKGHEYMTVFVDMENHGILCIEQGKDGKTIENFAQKLPDASGVEEVSIDMSPAFIAGVQRFLPKAAITFDKWHVWKLFFKHFEAFEQQNKGIIEFRDYVFAEFTQIFEQRSVELAKGHLVYLMDYIQDFSSVKVKSPLIKCLENHFDGIVNYVQSGLTNGILEGINSKIQTIKRVAKGFRSFNNFKKMILFVFGVLKPIPNAA